MKAIGLAIGLATLSFAGALVAVAAPSLRAPRAVAPLRHRVPSANETLLYSFLGVKKGDGSAPYDRLLADKSNGKFYGTTEFGGGKLGCKERSLGCGTVFELDPDGSGYTETVRYRFQGFADGARPLARLFQDSSGALYGTTSEGGTYRDGVVFKLTPSGSTYTESVLYSFRGFKHGDGAGPAAALSGDASGDLFGTTLYGGARLCNCGTVFELKPNGTSYSESVLWAFQAGGDGAFPYASVNVNTSTGALYGTTEQGGGSGSYCGTRGCGTVFVLAPATSGYKEKILYHFQGFTDGAGPRAAVIEDSSGDLYGTTVGGGNSCPGGGGCGTIFVLSVSGSSYTESILYRFLGQDDGAYPEAPLVKHDTTFYGTTSGSYGLNECNCGTVYSLTPSASGFSESVLHAFAGSPGDGATPAAGLVIDKSGAIYGVTTAGGSLGKGAFFGVTP